MEFDGVAVSLEDRTQVEFGNRIEVEHPGQLLRRRMVGPSEQEVIVAREVLPVHATLLLLLVLYRVPFNAGSLPHCHGKPD